MVKRYATKHRAKKGQMRRFVLDQLKEATGPITSLDIATAWIAERGLNADDATRVIIRKRVGACLISLRHTGFVRNDEFHRNNYTSWMLQNPLHMN